MTELFTFESLSVLREPPPESLDEADVRWALEFSRREANLLAEKNEADPAWLLKAAQFAHDTGRYKLSQTYAKRVTATASGQTLARALLIQCMNYLAIANGPMAGRCANRLDELAKDSTDAIIVAIDNLVKGMNWQYNVMYMKRRQIERGAMRARPLFEEATAGFLAAGEADLAIRAELELTRALFELGHFFPGIDAIERATNVARESGCWNLIDRMILLFASNASDRGYRAGVEDVIRRCIAWCDYLGDAWSRVEALTVLGRFLYYTMPAGQPQLALAPDRYLQKAANEAQSLGITRLTASIDSTRYFLFRKAGDDKKVQRLLGNDLEEEEFRRKQAQENREEIERIAETRRRNTALRLHDGIEDSHDAFFVFDALRDAQGRCRDFGWAYMNRTAVKLFELSGSQVYLFSEARLIPQLAGLDDALIKAVDNRESFEDTHEMESEGSSIWLQRRVVPSGDGAVVTLRDVTAEKRIETVLRQAAESAKQSENTKTAFLASMSHEIRTPLNGVLGLTRMLAETELSPTQRAYVDNIVLSGDILLDLIGDVLDLSKIEAQEMHLSVSTVSLPSLISSVVGLFHGQAQERGTSLNFNIGSDVPETVLADGLRLRQILSNLIGNAVKFTERGGVQINVFTEEGKVVFEVQDTGIGISPEQIEHVFNRFKQAGSPVNRGTGLGLAITRALTELMGGEVSVVSELGHGSRFSVRLPLQGVSTKTAELTLMTSPRFEGRRVLVVDDNQINLLVSAHAVEKFGCETLCASDGREALEILAKQQFDLVFMDMQMPVLNGLEAAREIRRRAGDSAHIPIIALTAGALLQEQQACLEAGMDDFITKPITLESIERMLTRWLPEGSE